MFWGSWKPSFCTFRWSAGATLKQKHRQFHFQENSSLNAGLVKLKLLVTNGNRSIATKGRHAKLGCSFFGGSQLANHHRYASYSADLQLSAAECANSSSVKWHEEVEGGKKWSEKQAIKDQRTQRHSNIGFDRVTILRTIYPLVIEGWNCEKTLGVGLGWEAVRLWRCQEQDVKCQILYLNAFCLLCLISLLHKQFPDLEFWDQFFSVTSYMLCDSKGSVLCEIMVIETSTVAYCMCCTLWLW